MVSGTFGIRGSGVMAEDSNVQVAVAISRLEGRMKVMEDEMVGIRAFQHEALNFFSRHDAREEEREKLDKKRAHIHFVLLGGLITLVAGCAIALFTWILNGHHAVTEVSPAISQTAPRDAANSAAYARASKQ